MDVGVIGMGKMGLLHASLVNALPDARLVAIYDRSPVMKRFVGKALNNIKITNKYEDFASRKYDAIYVTTPIPSHFNIVNNIYSTEISRNIFVEKTLTSTYKQSRELCHQAEAEGGITMVGYMSRFSPIFQKTKALLDEEVIGEITSFTAYAYASDFADKKVKALSDKGGVTRDLGAHIIDLSLWFFGDLIVNSDTDDVGLTNRSDNGICFKVKGSSGITGTFDISWAKEGYRLPEFGLTITGSKGIFNVNADVVKLEKNSGEIHTWYRQDFNDNVPFLLAAPEYYRENAHFIEAITNGSKAEPDFITASRVDLLIEQAEGKI